MNIEDFAASLVCMHSGGNTTKHTKSQQFDIQNIRRKRHIGSHTHETRALGLYCFFDSSFPFQKSPKQMCAIAIPMIMGQPSTSPMT